MGGLFVFYGLPHRKKMGGSAGLFTLWPIQLFSFLELIDDYQFDHVEIFSGLFFCGNSQRTEIVVHGKGHKAEVRVSWFLGGQYR
jgi:hypothetical protein